MRLDVPHWTVRVWRHVGRRGVFFAFLALVDMVFGQSLTDRLPPGLDHRQVYAPFVSIMPLSWWAHWWTATALLAAVAVMWHAARFVAFPACAALKTAWALGYLVGWREHLPFYVTGYRSAAIWGAFAALVLLISAWRENWETGAPSP